MADAILVAAVAVSGAITARAIRADLKKLTGAGRDKTGNGT